MEHNNQQTQNTCIAPKKRGNKKKVIENKKWRDPEPLVRNMAYTFGAIWFYSKLI